jgi:hypothetical protein
MKMQFLDQRAVHQLLPGGMQYHRIQFQMLYHFNVETFVSQGDTDTVCAQTIKGVSMKGKNLFRGQMNKAVFGK